MRKLLLAAALLWAAPANAAVLTYNYQGQPFVGYVPSGTNPWSGQLVIDEALLPSGTIMNASLAWSWSGWTGMPLSHPSTSTNLTPSSTAPMAPFSTTSPS